MKVKYKYFLILLFTFVNTTSCSVLFTNDFEIDHKVLNMAETEVYSLKNRSGVLESYDPRAALANQAGQRIFSSVVQYLQSTKKTKVLEALRYEVVILNDNKMDCYSLGGGKIIIHAGLLNLLTSEDEIAYVIAHELAHEIEKHSYKKLKSSLLADIGQNIIANVVDNEDKSKELYLSAFGVTSSAFGGMKFSSKEEMDADELALLWVAKSQYNPKAAPTVIAKLESLASGGMKVTFIEVHPTSQQLRSKIEALSEKYFQEYFLPSR